MKFVKLQGFCGAFKKVQKALKNLLFAHHYFVNFVKTLNVEKYLDMRI